MLPRKYNAWIVEFLNFLDAKPTRCLYCGKDTIDAVCRGDLSNRIGCALVYCRDSRVGIMVSRMIVPANQPMVDCQTPTPENDDIRLLVKG